MRSFLTLGIGGASILCAAALFAQSDATVESAVDAIDDELERCWTDADAAGCAALYTEDADSIDPAGQTVSGRAAIESAMALTFEQFGDSTIAIERASVHVVHETLVVTDGTWEVSGEALAGVPNRGFYTMILTKVGGDWLIASDQAKIAPPALE